MYNRITKEMMDPTEDESSKHTIKYDILGHKGESHNFIVYDFKGVDDDFFSFGNCDVRNIIRAAFDLKNRMVEEICRLPLGEERTELLRYVAEIAKENAKGV